MPASLIADTPASILAFWFPEGDNLAIDAQTHHQHWFWRMRGGADQAIVEKFGKLTQQAAAGQLNNWADTAQGRLALIILLDQFSRSVWRDSAAAFAQDPAALSLCLEGLGNGHYAALTTPWQKIVFCLPLGHCEGPDHLQRLDRLLGLRQAVAHEAPAHLQTIYQNLHAQAGKVRQVIAAFGRHPHRNQVLGRSSSEAEKHYISEGVFPHLQAFEQK